MALCVVYDACVLFPAPLRDLLMRVAHAGLVRTLPFDTRNVQSTVYSTNSAPVARANRSSNVRTGIAPTRRAVSRIT
jgi:hypothetical protein